MIDQGFSTVVASDFNCIDGPEQMRGGQPFVEDIGSREFKEFLYANGLVHLRFVGLRFTRYNNQHEGTKV